MLAFQGWNRLSRGYLAGCGIRLSSFIRSCNNLHRRLPFRRKPRRHISREPSALQRINSLHQYSPSLKSISGRRRWRRFLSLNHLHLWGPSLRRKLLRRWKGALCVLLVVAAALAGGHRYYKQFRRERVLANARAELALGRRREAALLAFNVIQNDPANLEASELEARALSDYWPRDAIKWYQRAAALAPGRLDNGLGWARTAFRLGRNEETKSALAGIASPGANVAEYHWLRAKAAYADGDLRTAEAELEKTVALSPDPAYGLELAKVQLLLPGAMREMGLASLERARDEPATRLQALRTLVADAAKQGPPDKALEYVTQLGNTPDAGGEDRLTCLLYLLRTNSPAFDPELRRYEKESFRDADAAAGILLWMSENNLPLLALDWAGGLPAEVSSSPRVRVAIGEAYVVLGDWDRLNALAAQGDWNALDFLRAALLARAQREKGDTQDADSWKLAVLKAETRGESLVVLCKLAESWGWNWNHEAEDVAWKVADLPHPPASVLRVMHNRFVASGETAKLYRLTARLRQLDPGDRVSQNNLALVSLLLRQNEQEASLEAERLYHDYPGDYETASTYAFSLYLQGRTAQALAVMQQFPGELRNPSVAAYYGIMLAAAGRQEEAESFLRIASRAGLLPEEQLLVRNAEGK